MAGKSRTLALGGPAPSPAGARYAELSGDGPAQRYVVSQGVASELSFPFDKFREPRLLEHGRSELAKLELEQKTSKLELEQGDHGAFFARVDGARELANRDTTERILTALSRLSTEHSSKSRRRAARRTTRRCA
jgi:hypothetical protein